MVDEVLSSALHGCVNKSLEVQIESLMSDQSGVVVVLSAIRVNCFQNHWFSSDGQTLAYSHAWHA